MDAFTWGLEEARKLHDQAVTYPVWDAEDRVFESRANPHQEDIGLDEAWNLRDALYDDIWMTELKDGFGESPEFRSWQWMGEDHLAWIYRDDNLTILG